MSGSLLGAKGRGKNMTDSLNESSHGLMGKTHLKTNYNVNQPILPLKTHFTGGHSNKNSMLRIGENRGREYQCLGELVKKLFCAFSPSFYYLLPDVSFSISILTGLSILHLFYCSGVGGQERTTEEY